MWNSFGRVGAASLTSLKVSISKWFYWGRSETSKGGDVKKGVKHTWGDLNTAHYASIILFRILIGVSLRKKGFIS